MVSTTLNDDERRVYEFVVRRFLACCSEDAKGESTTVEVEYGDETFFTNGLLVLQRNYLDVYPYEKWESSQQLPNFTVGETFEPTEANITDGETTPPGYLTEPELISLMDANGIGTDATMAEHIAKIKERDYVKTQPRAGSARGDTINSRGARGGRGRGGRGGRGGGNVGGGGNSVQQFIPTTLGVALIEGYDNVGLDTSLGKPFLRKEMEIKMKEICAGTKTRHDFVHETLEQYREVFVRTQQQVEVLKAVSDELHLCSDIDEELTLGFQGVQEIRLWQWTVKNGVLLYIRSALVEGVRYPSRPPNSGDGKERQNSRPLLRVHTHFDKVISIMPHILGLSF